MSIQLIDKIKQKNNGQFFLLDAIDIDYSGDGLKNLKDVVDSKADKVDGALTYTSEDKAKVDGAIQSTEKGAKNGVATLDENGFIPSSQIPGGYDDIYPAENKEGFPGTGDKTILYYALDSGLLYRWVENDGSGSYVELPIGGGTADRAVADSDGNQFQSTYLKITDADNKYVAKESGKGLSTNDYTNEEKSKLANLSQAASVFVSSTTIGTDADVALTSFVVPSGITPKVGDVIIDQYGDRVTISSVSDGSVHTGTTKYSAYHAATADSIGAVKPGTGLSVDGSGTLSVDTSSILSKSEADSTYLPLAGGTMTGDISFGSGQSISGTEYTGNAASATKATQDGAGNVIVDTYATKQEVTDSKYTLPAATTSTLGGVIVGDGLSVSSGTVSVDLTSKVMEEEDIENLLNSVFGELGD